ncbi:hypothetical protein C8259_24240 [Nocardia nova]|uniref:Uncharacterized protein n=1 Tax=Nocardia nova TaxID=37330 RepID=A0A2T2YXN7_9NOCA|nr:hypothetical protein C8259_24240 [Nocardia nova]
MAIGPDCGANADEPGTAAPGPFGVAPAGPFTAAPAGPFAAPACVAAAVAAPGDATAAPGATPSAALPDAWALEVGPPNWPAQPEASDSLAPVGIWWVPLPSHCP